MYERVQEGRHLGKFLTRGIDPPGHAIAAWCQTVLNPNASESLRRKVSVGLERLGIDNPKEYVETYYAPEAIAERKGLRDQEDQEREKRISRRIDEERASMEQHWDHWKLSGWYSRPRALK